MYKPIALIILVIGSAFTSVADVQPTNTIDETNQFHLSPLVRQVDGESVFRGDLTNGLGFEIRIHYANGAALPFCEFHINNENTNSFYFLRLPPPAMLKMDLFDLAGKAVEKTDYGKTFGTWRQKEIHEWGIEQYKANYGSHEFLSVQPGGALYYNIGIPQIFLVEKPGEYILHAQMCLINNGNGERDASSIPTHIFRWMPEVVAKVQIRPQDIPQTNSLPK
jgi:hypothetical protein